MLQLNEIYTAICGESRFSGYPCVLVRLTGCHLRCHWCDSTFAFSGGQQLSVAELLNRIRQYGFPTVLLTGGEPLIQPDVVELMSLLVDDGYRVLLETSGTVGREVKVALGDVPNGVSRIVDIKAPGSGVPAGGIDWAGISQLNLDDELKVVCANRADYEWIRGIVIEANRWPAGLRVGLSCVQGELEARDLAEWILADKLDVCFQTQLHKVVWPDKDRGV